MQHRGLQRAQRRLIPTAQTATADPTVTADPPVQLRGSTSHTIPISPALRAQQELVLKRQLMAHLDGQLDLTITSNRSVMLTVRRDPKYKRYVARVHHIFSRCSPEVVRHLALYIRRNDRTASIALNQFIEDNDHRVERRTQRRPRRLVSEGKVYDLRAAFDELNQRYFSGALEATIGWGRNRYPGRRRRSIRLGSYTFEDNLIRIHPGLDQVWVPELYLQWVVYHEMLHIVHPVVRRNGRRAFHTAEFLRDEKKYEHYEFAQRWERSNIPALLSL